MNKLITIAAATSLATTTLAHSGGCPTSYTYNIGGSIDLRVERAGADQTPFYSVGIDLFGVAPGFNIYDALITDPEGNTFDPAGPFSPQITFSSFEDFRDYTLGTLIQDGWTLQIDDPTFAAPQQFDISFFTRDAADLTATIDSLTPVAITSPVEGTDVCRNMPTVRYTPGPLPAPQNIVGQWRQGVTFTPDDFDQEIINGFPNTGTVQAQSNFVEGTLFVFLRFFGQLDDNSDPSQSVLDLAFDDTCSNSGEARINQVFPFIAIETTSRVRVNATDACGCGPVDLDGNNLLDLADISLFVDGFVNAEPVADLAEPFGIYDLNDISAFVAAFQTGCP